MSAILFFTLSTAQIVFAVIGNSLALMADAAAMYVDVVLYVTAIYCESIPKSKARYKRIVTLVVSFISIVILLGLCIKFTIDGAVGVSNRIAVQYSMEAAAAAASEDVSLGGRDVYGRNSTTGVGEVGLPWLVELLQNRSQSDDGLMKSNLYNGITATLYNGILPSNTTLEEAGCDNIGAGDSCDMDDEAADGATLMIFGVIGLLIDLACLFYGVVLPRLRNKKRKQNINDDDDDGDGDDDDDDDNDNGELNVNTMAAYAHVAADLIRSATAIIAAALIITKTPGYQFADDVASLVANVTIILGCTVALWEWWCELQHHHHVSKDECSLSAEEQQKIDTTNMTDDSDNNSNDDDNVMMVHDMQSISLDNDNDDALETPEP